MRSDNMLLLHGNNRYHAKEREYQGTEIAAENTYRAELGLHLYGRSWQETTAGANLVNDTYEFLSQNDAKITIVNPDADFADREWQVNGDTENGNNNTGIAFSVNSTTENIKVKIGETYTVSGYVRDNFNSAKPFRIIAFYTDTTGFEWASLKLVDFKVPEQIAEYTRYSMTFIIKEDFDTNVNRITVAFSNLGGNYYFTKPMLQRGNTLTDYEPYTGGIPSPNPDYPQPINSIGDSGSVDVVVSDNNGNSQTLTINTPNGLCGIPVDTGGNYTDSTGQQWICDEIDFERGVFVQRVKKSTVKTLDRLHETEMKGRYVNWTILSDYGHGNVKSIIAIASYFAWGKPQPLKWVGAVNTTGLYISPPQNTDYTVDTLKSYLTPLLPFEVCGVLATPIETPLTEEELAAYKAIKSYPYYTHIESAAELGVKLKIFNLSIVIVNF